MSPAKRRKSAFAEEDEGYQFVEEGFRIRFANGETIDFYADSSAQKEQWMEALSGAIGKPGKEEGKAKKWTEVVLAKERVQEKKREEKVERRNSVRPAAPERGSSKGSTGSKEVKSKFGEGDVDGDMDKPSVPLKDVGRRAATPPLSPRTGHRQRSAVKSMIF